MKKYTWTEALKVTGLTTGQFSCAVKALNIKPCGFYKVKRLKGKPMEIISGDKGYIKPRNYFSYKDIMAAKEYYAKKRWIKQ